MRKVFREPKEIPTQVVEAPKREVKKPFTFKNLQVTTDPNEIMESTSTYTYIQGTENESILAPLDNVFDPSVEQANFFGTFLELTENPNGFEYKEYNRTLAIDLTNRALSAIMFNALGIYENGLKKFINQFLKPDKNGDMPITIDGNGFNEIMYRINYTDLFGARFDKDDLPPIESRTIFGHNVKEYADDLLTNAMDCTVLTTEHFSHLFNRLISNAIARDKVNIKAIAQYVIESDGMNFSDIDESQYIGIAVGAMNQVAIEDIKKIKEIAEVHFIQAASQYNAQSFKVIGPQN